MIKGSVTVTGSLAAFGGYRLHTIQEFQNTMAAEFIKHLQSLLLVSNESGIPKLGQMPGDSGHVGTNHLGEFIDAMPAFGKRLNDRQAGRISQCLEYLGTFP